MREEGDLRYQLQYAKRKTIGIYVEPNMTVKVKAPYFVSRLEVHRFVQEKQSWIERQLEKYAEQPQKIEPRFEWGGSIHVLGTPKVFHCHQETEVDIVIRGNPSDPPVHIQQRLDHWFKQESLKVFTARHDYWRIQLAAMKLPASRIKVRRMKRRWGSCRQSGDITLNSQLLKYPVDCIDAVVVHELCHLIEFNHSPRFYRLMDVALPHWKRLDDSLNDLSLRY